MLKPKLQYFGHLMQRADSVEKTLMLGKIEGRRRMGPQRMRWLDDITDSMDISFSKLENSERWGGLACCSPWDCKELEKIELVNNNDGLNTHAFSHLLRFSLIELPRFKTKEV